MTRRPLTLLPARLRRWLQRLHRAPTPHSATPHARSALSCGLTMTLPPR